MDAENCFPYHSISIMPASPSVKKWYNVSINALVLVTIFLLDVSGSNVRLIIYVPTLVVFKPVSLKEVVESKVTLGKDPSVFVIPIEVFAR